MTGCWFADTFTLARVGRCEGGLVRCHLITQHKLLKEFPLGATWDGEHWIPVDRRTGIGAGLRYRTLAVLQADPRSWVRGCGGASGFGGHHGKLDSAPHDSSRIVLARSEIPAETEEYAHELRLGAWMDHTYGTKEAAAA